MYRVDKKIIRAYRVDKINRAYRVDTINRVKNPQFLQSLWRRANARNVSFFYSLRWLIYVFNPVVNTKLPATEYKDCLRLASMDTLTQRRVTASLIMFFKAYRLQWASYTSNFFTSRVCHYNLRSSALNVSQPVNTSSYIHSSFSYIISHTWNQLPSSVKSATTLAEFKTGLSRITTLGCKCNKCISIQL